MSEHKYFSDPALNNLVQSVSTMTLKDITTILDKQLTSRLAPLLEKS